jgi:hypothetical protein
MLLRLLPLVLLVGLAVHVDLLLAPLAILACFRLGFAALDRAATAS